MKKSKYFVNNIDSISMGRLSATYCILLCTIYAQQPSPKMSRFNVFFNLTNTLFFPFLRYY